MFLLSQINDTIINILNDKSLTYYFDRNTTIALNNSKYNLLNGGMTNFKIEFNNRLKYLIPENTSFLPLSSLNNSINKLKSLAWIQ